MAQQVTADNERQKKKLVELERDLDDARAAADAAQGVLWGLLLAHLAKVEQSEAQRRTSETNLSLSEDSLHEYRQL